MSGVVPNAPWQWMQANGLPSDIPDDAYLAVDEVAGTITVEVFVRDSEGRMLLHARKHRLTAIKTFPLTVSPPPGLIDAYQRTVTALRRERDAATAIRYETADTLIDRLGLDPARVFEALDLPVPTSRLQELP